MAKKRKFIPMAAKQRKKVKDKKAAKEEKNQGGRPKLPVRWSEVDRLAEAGNNAKECADYLCISYDTLLNRFNEELKETCGFASLSAYIASKRNRGNALLKLRQYKAAMDGCKTLLVWLGKNRLGQVDKKEVTQKTKKWVYLEKDAAEEIDLDDDEALEELFEDDNE